MLADELNALLVGEALDQAAEQALGQAAGLIAQHEAGAHGLLDETLAVVQSFLRLDEHATPTNTDCADDHKNMIQLHA